MKKDLRNEAVKLRINQRLSYQAIQKKLGVAKSTLSYWLRDYPLTDREILSLRKKAWAGGEGARERYRQTMADKRSIADDESYNKWLKKLEKIQDQSLLVAGLMLYWCEGDKKNRTRIVLANTDPKMIKFFMAWLVKYLKAPENKMRIQLHLYDNMDVDSEVKYWYKYLGIRRNQLYRPMVREVGKNSFTYRESFRHGTCSLYLLGVDYKREIMSAIKAFLDLSEK